jgi:proteic killer suppression protein
MAIRVVLRSGAQRALLRVPPYIADKLALWVNLVETEGIAEARRIPGFHDEPLRGARAGQRSIRLSRGYRAIYTIERAGADLVIAIAEVSKHAY